MLHALILGLGVGLVSAPTVGERHPAPMQVVASAAQATPTLASAPTLPPAVPNLAVDASTAAASAPAPAACTARPDEPLPAEDDPTAGDFWAAFKAPLPTEPVWDPPGPRRVGLQVGHWQYAQRALELFHLDPGGAINGVWEWEVALDIAQRAQRQLESAGVGVDLLDMTVPERYRAHAFVAIHADSARIPGRRGFKLARPGFSSVPAADDRLVAALDDAYAGATGLPRDDRNIGDGMRYYYAFNSRRYCHAVAPGVPQAILEAGYLTSADDREVLLDDPDTAARGIVHGLLRFLGLSTAQPAPHGPPRVAAGQDEVVSGAPARPDLALVFQAGDGFEPAPAVLDVLAAKHYRATFFVTGRWAERYPNLLIRIAADGHEVASRGYTVSDLTRVDDEQVRADLEAADAAVAAVTGRSTRPLWSPSAGARDGRVRAIAASLGYRPILWSVDGDGPPQTRTGEDIYRRVMRGAANGAIIVLHLDGPNSATATVAALPRLIDDLRAAGYRLVTITDLLAGSAAS